MGFKTDWSFLDKISMGAVGTEAVYRASKPYRASGNRA